VASTSSPAASPRTWLARAPYDPAGIAEAVAVLNRGGLVIIPTDTVYGLAAHPNVPGAEERMYRAKCRDPRKPIPLLAAGRGDVEAYGAALGPAERRLADAFWPGALTLILAARGREEGFRVPDDALARLILRAAGGLLRATSANLSGDPPALTAQEAAAALGPAVDFVVDAGPVRGGMASTVVKVERGQPRVLRAGALAPAEIERACR
jgi:L-threonylcarbamoyladenylate synthase